MKQILSTSLFFRLLSQSLDLIILNLLALVFYFTYTDFVYDLKFTKNVLCYWSVGNITYIVSLLYVHVILYHRIVRPEDIISRVNRTMLIQVILFLVTLNTLKCPIPQVHLLISFYIPAFGFVCMGRLFFRKHLKNIRRYGQDVRTAILIGSGDHMKEIAHMMTDPWNGYQLLGIFHDTTLEDFPENITSLGNIRQTISWLEQHKPEEVYCGLPSVQADAILPIMNYCDNNLIRFYIVPSYRNYLKRQMTTRQFGDYMVLTIRKEPLGLLKNRILKRGFDVLCSSLFLCTFYPILYVIIGIAIKLSSPGPVYFKQERTGLDGKTFKCLKFRSMVVNNNCDKLQATKNDPRKTKIGDFLRHTNLDELPQFINVWKGEMSLVGPRPHMLQHTETYSHLINQYMVRHLIKPGITGWAQIHGLRGETRQLANMKNRVKFDIWYLENWNIWLDIYILYKTITNMLDGENNAY